jgi:hypothetical protein
MQLGTLEHITAQVRAEEEDERGIAPGEERGLLHWTRRLEGDLNVLLTLKTNAEVGLDDVDESDLDEAVKHTRSLAVTVLRAYDALAAELTRRHS